MDRCTEVLVLNFQLKYAGEVSESASSVPAMHLKDNNKQFRMMDSSEIICGSREDEVL